MSLWKYHISFKITQTLTQNLKKYFEGGGWFCLHRPSGSQADGGEDFKNTSSMSESFPLPQQEYE